MSRLNVLDDALRALADLLDDRGHGPACVCTWCEAYRAATTLLPRLGDVLAVLRTWERHEHGECLRPQDIRMLLTMLAEDSTVRPAAQSPPAGEGER